MSTEKPSARSRGRLAEIAGVFGKLGLTAFGGPAAHIAMLEDEVVERRKWLSAEHFLDLVGATNLIPGPNSTEMALHVGYERAGWRGMLVSGFMFLVPAVFLTGVLAWAYTTWGSVPKADPLLKGIQAGVLAVILGAGWKLGKKAVKSWRHGALGLAITVMVLAGVDEVAALFVGGLLGMLWFRQVSGASGGKRLSIALPFLPPLAFAGSSAGAAVGAPLWKLGLFFLKTGAVLYGSGYVLIAFIEGSLVNDFGWLTNAEVLDAIAIGQLTPGPILSTATFVGYLVAGVPGAAIATLGIFLPSFIFVLILNPVIPKLRKSAWTSAFLDAVNVAAMSLMAAVTISMGLAVLVSPAAWAIAVLAAVLVLRSGLSAVWIVIGSALVGLACYPLGMW
jgi:chromate transporter